MRILLLSGNTGEGHNSAARALKEVFESRGHEAHLQNGLIFLSEFKNTVICKGHVLLYRKLPHFFGIGYRFEEKRHQHMKYQQALRPYRKHPPTRFNNLKVFIEDGKYDVIICTHPFAASIISKMRVAGMVNLPCYFVATDYTCSPTVNQYDLDGWFIPHRELISEFMSYGIPAEKLIPTGIPVMPAFNSKTEKAEARRRLHLPEDKRIVVLSCGSMGASSMGRLVLLLVETLPEDTLLVAICGNNQSLERNLRRLIRSEKLKVMGFVDRMDTYMDAADLYLSKPGGLSTTEAIFKRVPMALIHAVPGCETRNLEFLTTIGCAISAPGPIKLARLVRLTLNSGESLEYLTKKCAVEFTKNGADEICDTVIERHAIRLLDGAGVPELAEAE